MLFSRLRQENPLAADPLTENYSCLGNAAVISNFGVGVAVTPALDFAVDKTAEDGNEGTRSASAGKHRGSAGIEDARRKDSDRWPRVKEEVH